MDSQRNRPASYTGRSRRKRTSWSVKFGDLAARVMITTGGIGTIVAVSLVFVFLGFVVLPLFYSASTGKVAEYEASWVADQPVELAIDEYQTMGWALYDDGTLQVFRLDTGETIDRTVLLAPNRELTATSRSPGASDLALGFADGTMQFGRIGFDVSFRERRDMPEEFHRLNPGESMVYENSVVQLTPQGQYRLLSVAAELKEPIKIADAAIRRLDHFLPEDTKATIGAKTFRFAAYTENGQLLYGEVEETKSRLSGRTKLELSSIELPVRDFPSLKGDQRNSTVLSVLLAGRGDNVFLVRECGNMVRYDTRVMSEAKIVEEVDLLPHSSTRLTVCDFVLMRETIICGDEMGGLRAWFRIRCDEEDPLAGEDGFRMALAHELERTGNPIRCFAASERSRMIAVGDDVGHLRVYHVTTDQRLLELEAARQAPLAAVVIAPKDDGLFAATNSGVWRCEFNPAHPESTVSSLFQPVWYEGYSKPLHLWQSSFAGVGPEMKLGLWPLIFGTLKATFYSMLFGAPLALLAAIYTSEFLTSDVRARVKPGIEMMASLPSVVLGFLAGLVFAPLVEGVVPEVMTLLVFVPLSLLLGSQLWGLLPHPIGLRLAPYRLVFVCFTLAAATIPAWLLGPWVEDFFFAGNMMRWLDGQIGNGIGAWMYLMLPGCSLAIGAFVVLSVNTWLRKYAHRMSRTQFAAVNLMKTLCGIAVAFVGAYLASVFLNSLGWDPRGTFVDTYEQRNALIVGFVMGFAIIPIIYTLADDALSTVPNHLRSGSLGCGATAWQTTWRVVIPTAMSGLFSALMIGLGRAVGETMIVLMAAGNTPVTDWNLYNGFRTLAANIAVELPEAPRDSTHYRTLFLAALTLFVLTFVINTVAEIVRLRFRKRAYQL